MDHRSEMTAEALAGLLRLFESAGIGVWLDGGWGVDALLQEQTRPHKDVDIIPRATDVPTLRRVLAARVFAVRERQPVHYYVPADGEGLEVDGDAVTVDSAGNGGYRMQNGDEWIYPAEGFSGQGIVGGMSVRCLSPEVQVLCHAH